MLPKEVQPAKCIVTIVTGVRSSQVLPKQRTSPGHTRGARHVCTSVEEILV